MTTLAFVGAAIRLRPGDFAAEAADLGCHPAAIRAVIDVEPVRGACLLALDERPLRAVERQFAGVGPLALWRRRGSR